MTYYNLRLNSHKRLRKLGLNRKGKPYRSFFTGNTIVEHHNDLCHGAERPDDVTYMTNSEHLSLHNNLRLKNGTHHFLAKNKQITIGLLIFVFLFTLISCATVKPFPSENIVISAPTAFGRIYVRILKRRLGEEHRGEWWVTEERFIELKLKGEIPEDLLDEEI